MTELLLPVAVLIVSLAMTYFFCLRPMRTGQACHQPTPRPTEADLDRALTQAKQELEQLRTAPANVGVVQDD